jgi:hypothetical protein
MRFLIGPVAAVIFWTAGCDRKSGSPLETKTSEGQATEAPAGKAAARGDRALVRFINADPRDKSSELWAGDTRLFTAIAYKDVSPYLEIPSQATQFRLREANGTANLASIHDELFAGRSYTYVALPGKDSRTSLAELSDDLKPPKAGKARVRVINATRHLDNLELYRVGGKKGIGPRVRTGASTDFKDVDPGTFEIRPANQPPVEVLSNLVVDQDRFYTFVVLGSEGNLDVVRVEERLDR